MAKNGLTCLVYAFKTYWSLRNRWDALEVPLISSSVWGQKGPLISLSGSGRKRNQVWKIWCRINRNRKAILNFQFRQCKTELRFWKSGISFRFPKVLFGRTLHLAFQSLEQLAVFRMPYSGFCFFSIFHPCTYCYYTLTTCSLFMWNVNPIFLPQHAPLNPHLTVLIYF